MSSLESPTRSARHTAQLSYADRVSQIEKKGGVAISDPSDPAKGWALAIQRAESRKVLAAHQVQLHKDWQTLQAGLGGCSGPKEKKNSFEGWNWKVNESDVSSHYNDIEEVGQLSIVPRRWIDISAGCCNSACAVDDTGTGWCWGSDTEGLVPPKNDHFFGFDAVTMSYTCSPKYSFSCWRGSEDGSATCYGGNVHVVGKYDGPFRQITAGFDFYCGIMFDHSVKCFGDSPAVDNVDDVLGLKFSTIEAGTHLVCGILQDTQKLKCWGEFPYDIDFNQIFYGAYKTVSLTNSSGGGVQLCAITSTTNVQCITSPGYEFDEPVGANFESVSIMSSRGGILSENGSLVYWGVKGEGGGVFDPLGPFSKIAVGGTVLWTLDMVGKIGCVGCVDTPDSPWKL